MFRDRRMLKTAAASMDETIEPSNIPSRTEKPRTYTAQNPVITAIYAPAVESESPCQRTGPGILPVSLKTSGEYYENQCDCLWTWLFWYR